MTSGGAPVYVWPGGGITFMVDVTAHAGQRLRLCADAGDRRADRVHAAARPLSALGGHAADISSLAEALRSLNEPARVDAWREDNPWPLDRPQGTDEP